MLINILIAVLLALIMLPNLVVAFQPIVLSIYENPWIAKMAACMLIGFAVLWRWLWSVHRKHFPDDPPL